MIEILENPKKRSKAQQKDKINTLILCYGPLSQYLHL